MTAPPDLAGQIIGLLGRRAPQSTICPSEVARLYGDGWRELMPEVRAAAASLADEGIVIATRSGEPVHPQQEGGPIRLARGPDFPVEKPAEQIEGDSDE